MLLRQGVDALGKTSGKLEMAEMEFERRLRCKNKERGAS
jgi:hypothetical protein